MAAFSNFGFTTDADNYSVLVVYTSGKSAKTDCITNMAALRIRDGLVQDHLQNSSAAATAEFLGNDLIICQRARSFTLRFFKKELKEQTGTSFDNDYVDLAELADACLWNEVDDCKLSTLAAYLDVSRRPPVDAMDECLQVYHCYRKLSERYRADWDSPDVYTSAQEDFAHLLSMCSHPVVPSTLRNTLEYTNDGAQYDPLLRCCTLLPLIKYELDNDCFEPFLADELLCYLDDAHRGTYKRAGEEAALILADIHACLKKLNLE